MNFFDTYDLINGVLSYVSNKVNPENMARGEGGVAHETAYQLIKFIWSDTAPGRVDTTNATTEDCLTWDYQGGLIYDLEKGGARKYGRIVERQPFYLIQF